MARASWSTSMVLGLMLLARPALGDESKVRQPPAATATAAGVELLLGSGQVFLGGAISLATLYASALALYAAGPAGAIVAVASPALVGSVICWLGGKSGRYDGGCGPAILGAYLGALSIIPLGLLTDDNGEGMLPGFLGGVIIGWLLLQPLASTIAWHVTKDPRAGTPAPAALLPSARHPRLREGLAPSTRPRRQRLAGQLTIPVLSISF